MKSKSTLLTVAILLWTLMAGAQLQFIDNIQVAQRADASGLVDINFNLVAQPNDYYIYLEVSFEGDSIFTPILNEYISGDIGPIGPDTSYHIVWDGLQSYPDTYSSQAQLKLVASVCPEQRIMDADSNQYYTVSVGTQCWMKTNLITTKYRDGSPIDYPGGDDIAWQNSSGAYAWYGNDIGWKDLYGALYNWNAVNSINNLCPEGWHVPSDGDWTALTEFLGGIAVAGGKMKSTLTEPDPQPRWKSPNLGADNISNLSCLPGGSRTSSGTFVGDIGNKGSWWSSTEQSSTDAWIRSLNYYNGIVQVTSDDKQNGFSVRCLKD